MQTNEKFIAVTIVKNGGYDYHVPKATPVNPAFDSLESAKGAAIRAMGAPNVIAAYIEKQWPDSRGPAFGMHREMVAAWRIPHTVGARGGAPMAILDKGEPVEDEWRDLYNLEPLYRQS